MAIPPDEMMQMMQMDEMTASPSPEPMMPGMGMGMGPEMGQGMGPGMGMPAGEMPQPPPQEPMPPPEPPIVIGGIEYPPLEAVSLKVADEAEFANEIAEVVERAITKRAKIEETWRSSLAQYAGEVSRLDAPEEWEPDVDTQLTYTRSQARAARLINPIVQQDPPFVVIPYEGYEDFADAIEHYLKWKIDQMALEPGGSFREFLHAIVRDLDVFGMAVVKVPFVRHQKTIKEWVVEPAGYEIDDLTGAQVVKQVGRLVEKTYTVREGAFPETVSPMDFFWWPLNARTIDQCVMVAERKIMQRHEIEELVESGIFEPDCLDKLGEPYAVKQADVEKDETESAGIEAEDVLGFEVFEVYYKYRQGGKTEDIIVVYERKSKAILRKVVNFYADFRVPYIVMSAEPESRFLFGKSLAERISHLHRVVNASLNIELETAAMNGPAWAIWDDDLADQLEGRKIRPHEVLRVTRPPQEALMRLELGGGYTQLGAMRAWAEQRADMISATSLPMFGIEPVDRPTASGTIREIEEAQQPLFRQIDNLRAFLSRVMLAVIARDRQFFPAGLKYFIDTEGGKLYASAILSFPPGLLERQIIVVPKASAQDLSKASKKQDAVSLLDQLKGTYGLLLQVLGAAAQPSPVAKAALKMAVAIQKQFEYVLDVFDVPHAKDLVVNIEQEVQDAGRFMEVIQGLQQTIQALTARQGQAGMGPMPPGPGEAPQGQPGVPAGPDAVPGAGPQPGPGAAGGVPGP